MLCSFIARCVARCIVFKPGMFGVSLKEGFSSGTAGRKDEGVYLERKESFDTSGMRGFLFIPF